MSELARIKQAMCDGEHTDGDLAWCVERITALEAGYAEAIGVIEECTNPYFPDNRCSSIDIYAKKRIAAHRKILAGK